MAVDSIKKNEEIERDRYKVTQVEAYKPQEIQKTNDVKTTEVKTNYEPKQAQQVVAAAPQDTYTGAQAKGPGAEELAVAQVLMKNNRADMKPEELAKELSAQGMKVQANGKELNFLDENGNIIKTLKDTDGDGQIGMKDKEFEAAIRQLEATHPELMKLEQLHAQQQAGENGKDAAGIAAGYTGILNQAATQGNNVDQILAPVQAELEAKNYTEDTARGLYDNKKLQPVAQELGIKLPANLPEPGQNPYEKALNLFKMSLIPYVPYLMNT